MIIITLGGFLGSGKTTLLLELAQIFSRKGLKTAIIENEVGEIPIDSKLLQTEGYIVRELFSGCICCTLRYDLEQTVKDICEHISPDILLVEPSGVAQPEPIRNTFMQSGMEGDLVRSIQIIDYRRAASVKNLDKFFLKVPFVERSLQVCDIPVVNIPELVDSELLCGLKRRISDIHPNSEVFDLNACGDPKISYLAELLLERGASPALQNSSGPKRPQISSPDHIHSHHTDEAVAVARSCDLQIHSESENYIKLLIEQLELMLSGISFMLYKHCEEVIGHLKAQIYNESGIMSFSIVDFKASEITKRGFLSWEQTKLSLVLNLIVFNTDKEVVENTVTRKWDEFIEIFNLSATVLKEV